MSPPSSQQWTLNGDFVALKPTGVPRYARETVRAIDVLAGARHPLLEGVSLELTAPCAPLDFTLQNIPVRVVPEHRHPRLPQVWVQAQLPPRVRGGLVSFCNLAPVSIGRHIVCIHDLHTFLMPESYGRGFRLAHRLLLPLLGRRARKIATISEYSRSQLVAHGIAPADKIALTYNGADHAARWDAGKGTLSLGPRPYVFVLGQSQPYKNLALVLKIAPRLADLGIGVAIAGLAQEEALRLVGEGLGGLPANVHLTGRLTDEDLARALDGAFCFLFPSRIEGFGLPAVEAMTRGCPVIASTAPALPEVCGEAALYASPDDPEAWVGAVARLKENPSLRAELVAKGRERAQRYTWRRVAEVYLRLMAEVDGRLPATADMEPAAAP